MGYIAKMNIHHDGDLFEAGTELPDLPQDVIDNLMGAGAIEVPDEVEADIDLDLTEVPSEDEADDELGLGEDLTEEEADNELGLNG
jgi:hypothetical protein